MTVYVVETPDGRQHRLTGREAFAAHALNERRSSGVTPIDWVGPRWSHYVMLLCRRGFDIETKTESHGGPFAGSHGRYVLHTPLKVLHVERGTKQRGRKNAA